MWRDRFHAMETEFVNYRKNQISEQLKNTSPLEQLRSDLKIKTFKLEEANKSVSSLKASREHFKKSVQNLCGQIEALQVVCYYKCPFWPNLVKEFEKVLKYAVFLHTL